MIHPDITPQDLARWKAAKACRGWLNSVLCETHEQPIAACIADLSVDRSSLLAAYERVVEERKERDEWLLNERDLSAKINELLIEAREKNVTLTAQVQALEQELTDLRRVGREERDVLRAFVKRGIVEHGVGADDCPTCREATLLLSKEPTP